MMMMKNLYRTTMQLLSLTFFYSKENKGKNKLIKKPAKHCSN